MPRVYYPETPASPTPPTPVPSSVPGFYAGTGPPDPDELSDAATGSTYLDIATGNLYRKEQ